MTTGEEVSVRQSIAPQVLYVVLGIYLVVILIVGASQLFMAYRTHRSNMTYELKGIEDSVKGPLAVSIWGWDEHALRAVMQGILNVPMIDRVMVLDEKGSLIGNGVSILVEDGTQQNLVDVAMGGDTGLESGVVLLQQNASTYREYVIPLTYSFDGTEETVGHAVLFVDQRIIPMRVWVETLMMSVIICVSLFVFTLALLWAVNRYLRKPLLLLTNATAGISLENLDAFSVDTKVKQHNEIKILEETICAMVKDLIDALREKEELQNQLVQAQKMEAIGQMAGGMAHDSNNMLAAIMGCAELIELEVPDNPEVKELTEMILSAGERATDLTAKLMAFGREHRQEFYALDVHEVIEDTVSILKNTVDKLLVIHSHLLAGKTTTMGNHAQLQSVFLNLGINASHAMPKGGHLTISTRETRLDQDYCDKSIFDLSPGLYIQISVQDTGTGINPEHLAKIFDPFFTTKQQGEGTGLGLTVSYATVKQHKGEIKVVSEVGKGTNFRISLPVSEVEDWHRPRTERSQKGEGCVLVVDDEDMIRTTATALLEGLGYTVLSVKNGLEAVSLYLSRRDDIDVVLCDMIMPGMNGRDCFMELKAMNPDIRFVLASGYTREEDTLELKQNGLSGFIEKPYRKAQLSQMIADVLNA